MTVRDLNQNQNGHQCCPSHDNNGINLFKRTSSHTNLPYKLTYLLTNLLHIQTDPVIRHGIVSGRSREGGRKGESRKAKTDLVLESLGIHPVPSCDGKESEYFNCQQSAVLLFWILLLNR